MNTESMIRTKSRKLSAEEIEQLTKLRGGIGTKKIARRVDESRGRRKAIQNENEKKPRFHGADSK